MHPSSSRLAIQAPQAPIPTRQQIVEIEGVETQVVAQAFEDRVLIVVTQVGKVGQLIQATLPETLQLPPMSATPPLPPLPALLPPPHPSTTLLALFGTPSSPALQPIAEMYTSQIAAIVWQALALDGSQRKPVVVGLALKRRSREAVGDGDDAGDEEVDWGSERARFGQVMSLVMKCRVW